MAASAAPIRSERLAAYRRLTRRNRIVDVLRIVVPLAGVAVFVGLALQIYVANTARQYGIAGIRVDRDGIVFETPQFSGTAGNGARYLVTAAEAKMPTGEDDLIDMAAPALTYEMEGGTVYRLTGDRAAFRSRANRVAVPGIAHIESDDGLVGTIVELRADLIADTVTSEGVVDIVMGDGTHIVADTMLHEGALNRWTFTRATVTYTGLPEAEEE